MGAVAEFVSEHWGTPTHSKFNPVVASVAATPTKVLLGNPDRLSWSLVNLSANNIYLAWDNLPSSIHGVLVDSSGGSMSVSAEDDGELPTYEVWAIASGASDIYVIETLGQ